MTNKYCMFKGKLDAAAPYFDGYVGSPHYVITVTGADQRPFNIVVNSASTAPTRTGDNRVYVFADLHFVDPVIQKLRGLDLGLYENDFPKLDYFQDRSLLDITKMRPVPYEDEDGGRANVNGLIDGMLSIDETQAFEERLYFGGQPEGHPRKFWKPTDPADVIVYGFGFLFLPAKDGLHETHMNQGNPHGPHYKENGTFQDGAVIVQRGDDFTAIFTAFQTQYLPTDSNGDPDRGARPLPDFIRQG